eukprot:m.156343 g.156343  ORF g.156343 m.156343 type:complete len:405 (+) comp9802_c1_seq3:4875-6089(+)
MHNHGHGHGHGDESSHRKWCYLEYATNNRLQDSKSRKLALMICLTSSFMVVEIAFGIFAHSLALISDGFHMFSDVVGLIVGVTARSFSWKDPTHKMSYGFRRAETVGAFANGVFLLAICLFIMLDAIERFLDPPKIEQAMSVVIVGGIGLAINIAGLFLFHGHGHSHGGHGHEASASTSQDESTSVDEVVEQAQTGMPSSSLQMADSSHELHHKSADLNLQGVFIHVAGDALGSVGVMISGLIVLNLDSQWTMYVDPAVSVLIALIILFGSIPLVKKSGRILLQGTPKHIDLSEVAQTIEKVDGVVSLHELHCWLLGDNTAIASVHIKCIQDGNVMEIVRAAKENLHALGIHSATIQPEFSDPSHIDEACEIDCSSACDTFQCCPSNQRIHRRIISHEVITSEV